MKSWIASLFDHQIDLQERTFRLISVIGVSAIALMLVLAIVTGESVQDVLLILLSLLVFTGIVIFSTRFQRIQLGACVISAILIFLVLPFIFIASGGMYGGTPMWFIFASIFVSLVVRGRMRIFFLTSAGVVLSVCYILQWFRPKSITAHTAWMAYMDSWSSTLIVGLVTSIMVIFVTKLYGEEQRIAEERRKEIEEINRAQNRFFSNMSHEIRTPVNTIIGLNEMILREAVTPEVAEDARSIQGAGDMLLTLINDVLDMSKIESGKMELVPTSYAVDELLSEIVNMIRVRAREKGLEFRVDIDETTPRELIGDDVRIKQILINLLNNAVKYTQNGSVTLSVECKHMAGQEELERVDMIYTVSDTGIGIRKEAMPTLFDVFRRTDELKNRMIEGTGLGLSIVKQLVDLMGGEITVDSVYTRGSTFRIRIPQGIANRELLGKLTLETGHHLGEKKEYRQSFEAPNAAVLIVDDNDMNLAVTSKLLAATRLCIETAESGPRCLEHTQNRHYDLILMDHLMPGMDGIETLHAIRTQEGGLNNTSRIKEVRRNIARVKTVITEKSRAQA